MASISVPEGRLRSLSFNVVQEARRSGGHADAAWTDDDARKCDMIFKILGSLEGVTTDLEIGIMVPKHQPVTHPALVNVQRMLEDMAGVGPEADAVPVRAKVPTSK